MGRFRPSMSDKLSRLESIAPQACAAWYLSAVIYETGTGRPTDKALRHLYHMASKVPRLRRSRLLLLNLAKYVYSVSPHAWR